MGSSKDGVVDMLGMIESVVRQYYNTRVASKERTRAVNSVQWHQQSKPVFASPSPSKVLQNSSQNSSSMR